MSSTGAMTSMQRVLTTLEHREPDRVPLFLLPTMHGAKELELSLREYFSKAEHVAQGQLALRSKYGHDCVSNFFYAAVEVEAWGGEVLFRDDGPANAGAPFIRRLEDISALEPPRVADSPPLDKVLRCTALLKEQVGNEVPLLGLVMSPFSAPIMQLGFERYLELLLHRRELFWELMRVNEAFCVAWANAQLAAGATAISYFDPVSSPTIIPSELYRETGLPIAQQTLARIEGPTAIHLASGRALPIAEDLSQSGTAIIGVSVEEDLSELKQAFGGKLTLLGNLNGVEMRRWTTEEAEAAVKTALARGGAGGGFILADNHGEIPFQVPDDTLHAVAEAARQWGRYPLDWVANDV